MTIQPYPLFVHSANAGQPERTDYLSDLSPRDKPWDERRSDADGVSSHLVSPGTERPLFKLGKRVEACAPSLFFSLAPDLDTGEARFKLKNAYFCRVRHCPVCQWRRSLMWKARFLQALPTVSQDNPKGSWVLMTLTVKNCPVGELRQTLASMNKGWNLFANKRRAEWNGVAGWIRSTEITRGKDGSAHPHFHVLLFVRPNYFTKNYVKHEQWRDLWQKSMKLDYAPVIDVRRVKARPDQVEQHGDLAAAHVAAAEVLKYAVKTSDMLADRDWFLELVRQTHRTRAIASGGALKDVLRQEQETEQDLLLQDESESEDETEAEAPVLRFDYSQPVKRYKRTEA